jgi:hypothetical protein
MYPDVAQQTAHTTDFRAGDKDGLRLLGGAAGCLPASPSPSSAGRASAAGPREPIWPAQPEDSSVNVFDIMKPTGHGETSSG